MPRVITTLQAMSHPTVVAAIICLSEMSQRLQEENDELKAALSKPEQEPAIGDIRALKHRIHELEGEVIGYKQILDAQPEQDPVAWRTKVDHITFTSKHNDVLPLGGKLVPLYPAPPAQRTWVGLTDEERLRVLQFIDPKTVRLAPGFKQFAESVEQLLKEKNG